MRIFLFISLLLSVSGICRAQEVQGLGDKIFNFPQNFFHRLQSKVEEVDDKLDEQTLKYLDRLERQEGKINRKLAQKDSVLASELFSDSKAKYAQLKGLLKDKATLAAKYKQYIPHLDSLSTSLRFLDQYRGLISQGEGISTKIDGAMAGLGSLKDKLQKTEAIRQFLRQRREYLKEKLQNTTLLKSLSRYNKEVYYYSKVLGEYKEILNDPEKIEKKALSLLSQMPAFQKFMLKNSELASLFQMPGSSPDPAGAIGLQTRAQVQQLVQQQLSSGGPGAQALFQQNLRQGLSQLTALKDKINKAGGMNSDDEIPNFKPNDQKTKSFWKRLEYGANIQSNRSNGILPNTMDIGLLLGYKLNDKSVVGIGSAFKIGLGKDIRHVQVSAQGLSLRSFVDIKLKGSIYFSGGFEMNYLTVLTNISQLKGLSGWQQSGLIGISKVVSIKSTYFKKTKVQALWDFLSYQQKVRSQPFLFRVGYNF